MSIIDEFFNFDFGNRVQFKLRSASYFLFKLREVSSKQDILGGRGRVETEILLEPFLVNLLGASEALEIQVKRTLRANKEGQKEDQVLKPYFDARKKGLWLWRIETMRDMSGHTEYIGKRMEMDSKGRRMALPLDPTDSHSPRYPKDFLDDLQEMLDNTENLIEVIQGDPLIAKYALKQYEPRIPDRATLG